MYFELPLMGLAVYLLFWDKLPNWGTWFNTILGGMPKIVRTTYNYWNCAYCSGFWISLALHAITGRWFIETLSVHPFGLGASELVVCWFLDALAAGTVIYAAKTLIDVMQSVNKAMGHSCSAPQSVDRSEASLVIAQPAAVS